MIAVVAPAYNHDCVHVYACVLHSGHLKETIKEFLERRVKMKLAENLAEQLADKVSRDISNKEEQMRREYEDKLRR